VLIEEQFIERFIIFKGVNIGLIEFDPAGKRFTVRYHDDRGKVIDLENYNRDIIFTELTPKELCLIFFLKNLNSLKADDLTKYCSEWKFLSIELKQKLRKSYLSERVVEFLERDDLGEMDLNTADIEAAVV